MRRHAAWLRAPHDGRRRCGERSSSAGRARRGRRRLHAPDAHGRHRRLRTARADRPRRRRRRAREIGGRSRRRTVSSQSRRQFHHGRRRSAARPPRPRPVDTCRRDRTVRRRTATVRRTHPRSRTTASNYCATTTAPVPPTALGHTLLLYTNNGAAWDASRVRRRLRDLGIRRRIVKAVRSDTGWAGLTDAEVAVVRLVAEGLTNREVAEQLSSPPHREHAPTSCLHEAGDHFRVQLTPSLQT